METPKPGEAPAPFVPIALLGGLLVAAALYVLVLRGENAELHARLAHCATATAVAAATTPTPAAAPAIAPTPTPVPTPTPPASNAGPARLSDADRTAIRARLDAVTSPDKHVWFVVAESDPGAVALHGDLVAVFRQAGWPVDSAPASFPLRPGIFMFAADESPPSWVDDVLRALRDVGFQPTLGLGYRAYYEQRKRETPGWNGFVLAPDQPYVIAIGPR